MRLLVVYVDDVAVEGGELVWCVVEADGGEVCVVACEDFVGAACVGAPVYDEGSELSVGFE